MSNLLSEFRVATLNSWHGLSGRGALMFGLLETRAERLARLDRQILALRAIKPDVLFLQEVNPLPFRAYWFAEKLGMTQFSVTSNSGIKLGWGPPWNLNEGLVILVSKRLLQAGCKVQWLGAQKLSGDLRVSPLRVSQISTPWKSLQFHEARVACAIRITGVSAKSYSEKAPNSLIFANTHLHHPVSLTANNKKVWEELRSRSLSPEEAVAVLRAMKGADARRQKEADTLSTWLEGLCKPNESVILGGDFNAEPTSAPIQLLLRRGWQDLWISCGKGNDLAGSATWIPGVNSYALRSQKLHYRGKNFAGPVSHAYKALDALPRRIDYLFYLPAKYLSNCANESSIDGVAEVTSIERFGLISNSDALENGGLTSDFIEELKIASQDKQFLENPMFENQLISDHFGVCARVKVCI